jgi:hypothetical protein
MQIFQNLNTILKTSIFVIYMILTQFWQAFGIIIIAIINNRPWECIFIFLGFIIGRIFFGKTYHVPTMIGCTILTWVVFYFLTSAVPSFGISITVPCIFGICLAYALAIMGEYAERGKSDAS